MICMQSRVPNYEIGTFFTLLSQILSFHNLDCQGKYYSYAFSRFITKLPPYLTFYSFISYYVQLYTIECTILHSPFMHNHKLASIHTYPMDVQACMVRCTSVQHFLCTIVLLFQGHTQNLRVIW